MYSKQAVLINEAGLHARPAAVFVKMAKSFSSDITVKNVDMGMEPANAKSMIKVLSEGLCKGMTAEICAEGPDERQAVDSLIELIHTGFGEG